MITLLQQLIHRAAIDAQFRVQLQTDPCQAATSLGLTLDEEERSVLNEMRKQLAGWRFADESGPLDPTPMGPGWTGGRDREPRHGGRERRIRPVAATACRPGPLVWEL